MKGMKNKIEARADFETKIENDPIALLKAIKEHALNYQENWYFMSIILDSMHIAFTLSRRRMRTFRIT
jgi:hypothetical protein